MQDFMRRSLVVLFIFTIFLAKSNAQGRTSGMPLQRAEVLVLVGGRSLPETIGHVIAARGLAFSPDEVRREQSCQRLRDSQTRSRQAEAAKNEQRAASIGQNR